MKISVSICTFNRADSLSDTLDNLSRQRAVSDLEWELLLIDNNCQDHTPQVAAAFAQRLPMRYLMEPHQGLSHGRNRAIREARGDLIVFTDDDVKPGPSWLAVYADGLVQHQEADYFGGPIHPCWPTGRPKWVRDESLPLISGLLGYYDLGDEERPYSAGDMHPFGANFALSRKLFEKLAPFRTDLGVSGRTPGRGEEAEYLKRATEAGACGVYLPTALCLHTVHASHLNLRYLYRYGVQKGIAGRLMKEGEMSSVPVLLPQASFAMKGLMQLAKGRGDRARQCVINMGIQRGLSARKITTRHD